MVSTVRWSCIGRARQTTPRRFMYAKTSRGARLLPQNLISHQSHYVLASATPAIPCKFYGPLDVCIALIWSDRVNYTDGRLFCGSVASREDRASVSLGSDERRLVSLIFASLV